jgi:hypothetical protein
VQKPQREISGASRPAPFPTGRLCIVLGAFAVNVRPDHVVDVGDGKETMSNCTTGSHDSVTTTKRVKMKMEMGITATLSP